jgi:hypothetical protein
MTKEEILIERFNFCDKLKESLEKKMYNHFKRKNKKAIDEAKCVEDFKKIKTSLRSMPECAHKVFLFRELIIREKQLGIRKV